MLKKITFIPSLILFAASASYAGGPDTFSAGLDSHWYVGVLGGAAINIANSKSFYQNSSNGNASQSFDTTAYDVSGITGAELGYLWSLSHNNRFGFSANINYDIDANIIDIWHIETNIASSDPMDLKNSVEPKWQYNLLLNFMHDIGDSFSLGIDAGFSLLQANTALTITDVGNGAAGNQAAPGNHGHTVYAPGGVLGLQADLLVTTHSSLDFSLNDYIYAGKPLSRINSVDTTANDSLTKRKSYISIPTLLVGYTYHF